MRKSEQILEDIFERFLERSLEYGHSRESAELVIQETKNTIHSQDSRYANVISVLKQKSNEIFKSA